MGFYENYTIQLPLYNTPQTRKTISMGLYELYTIPLLNYNANQTLPERVQATTLFIECPRPHYHQNYRNNQTKTSTLNTSQDRPFAVRQGGRRGVGGRGRSGAVQHHPRAPGTVNQHSADHRADWHSAASQRRADNRRERRDSNRELNPDDNSGPSSSSENRPPVEQVFSLANYCYKYITINTTTNTLPVLSKFERAVMAWDGLDLLYVVPVDQNVYLRAWDLHVDKFRLSSCHIRGFSMIHPVPFP